MLHKAPTTIRCKRLIRNGLSGFAEGQVILKQADSIPSITAQNVPLCFCREYKALPPSKQKKYVVEHKRELDLFKSANGYLNKHRNKDDKIPLASWINEYGELIKAKKEIRKSTMSFSEQLKQVDRIRKMAKESMPKQPQRNREWEMER